MTLNEMVLTVWEMLGEPTDIDPTDGTANPEPANVDNTTAGYRRILFALNEAQRRVAAHRQVRGRQFRWRGGYASTTQYITKTSAYTLTSDMAVGQGFATLSGIPAPTDDEFNEYIIKIGNEIFRVVDTVAAGSVVNLNKLSETGHAAGTAVLLAPTYVDLPADAWIVSHVTEAFEETELKPKPRIEDVMFGAVSGEHSAYYVKNGSRLYVDDVDMEDTTDPAYRITYQRLPLEMSDTQACELPENVHWALVLWACGWGYWRSQDVNERKNMRDDFANFMRMTVMESMREYDHTDFSGQVREDYHGYR
jgi:hypothetical protein